MRYNASEVSVLDEVNTKPVDIPTDHDKIIEFINDCYKLKPKGLILCENKWKYMIRNVIRGKNVMTVGQSGFGKTLSVRCVQNVLNRPKFFINLGATQDLIIFRLLTIFIFANHQYS